MSDFPLQTVTQAQLRQVGRVLWCWTLCGDCDNAKPCSTPECPSPRFKRLIHFFDHYKAQTASYERDIELDGQPCLRSHEDLFKILQLLKENPDLNRAQLIDKLFHVSARQGYFSAADEDRVVNLAVRIMVMVNCSAQHQFSGFLEHGLHQVPWRRDVTFTQFITNIFPMTDHPSLNDDKTGSPFEMRRALTAKKLKKRARLKFIPTDDLRRHLMLDQKSGSVEIFHQTAFLKEHLRLTKDQPRNMSISDSLRIGALPRQLVLEVLDSIQKVLFPLSDPKSYSLLRSLTSTSSFDPDALRFESVSIRSPDEKDISYHYFGSRLMELYEELENPKPRGWIEKWVERKSGARYVMMATLVGVAIAVLLGMASLAVGTYQAWVGYQQWQHPVANGGS